MTELQALLEHVGDWPAAPSMQVATVGDVSRSLATGMRHYVIGECNRHTPLEAGRTFWRSLRIAMRERPDAVVTTGSLPLALFCLACRLFGARIVWIDSISQITDLSLSGRLVKPISSLFLVQWPELAERFPGTCYAGELI
jgi:UDP-N-acetylglucosamine:LPS N-acetylglucosamine transferase